MLDLELEAVDIYRWWNIKKNVKYVKIVCSLDLKLLPLSFFVFQNLIHGT